MRASARPTAAAAIVLISLALARPAPAADLKFGLGGGATFTSNDIVFGSDFKTGWTVTGRVLWFPSGSFLGVRGAGYYGQSSPLESYFLQTTVKNATLAGGDLNLAVRLTGKGAEGFYLNAGIGLRSYRQEAESPSAGRWTFSDTNISYNGGLGFSWGRFFAEANAVYFKVQESDFVSIPVTIGFQF
jgi:hypothetical protein